MNLATKITFVRVLLVPVFAILLLSNTLLTKFLALLVFIIGGISDTIDGIVARKLNSVTKIGTSFDPLADKLLVTTAFISFLNFKNLNIPVWAIVIIVVRDYIITWVRSLNYNMPIPADKTAKIKTMLQNFAIISILVFLIFEKQIIKLKGNKLVLDNFPRYTVIFISIFTLISGFIYFLKYWDFIKKEFEK